MTFTVCEVIGGSVAGSLLSYALLVVLSGIGAYIGAYFKTKGKNLATKEDVADITRRIEGIKHEYSTSLESVKTILNTRLFIHQVRYQNEFSMLLSLSEKLGKFRDSIASFEIEAQLSESASKDLAHTKDKALKVLAAMGALKDEYEIHKPFYPDEIYKSVQKLHGLAWRKLVMKGHEKNLLEGSELTGIIVDLVKERDQGSGEDKVSQIVEDIYAAIRRRVEYWENLPIV